jgi:hypothetical protein
MPADGVGFDVDRAGRQVECDGDERRVDAEVVGRSERRAAEVVIADRRNERGPMPEPA